MKRTSLGEDGMKNVIRFFIVTASILLMSVGASGVEKNTEETDEEFKKIVESVYNEVLLNRKSYNGEVWEKTDIRNKIKLCHEFNDNLKRLTCYDNLANDISTRRIEFKDLIKVFSFEEKATWNVLSWKTGSDNDSINWLTRYPVRNEGLRDDSPFIKKGRVLLSQNCEEDGDGFAEESPYWDIALLGAKVGVSRVVISRPVGHCYGVNGIGTPYTSAKELGCELCGATEGTNLYKVKLKNKKTVFLSERRSCGSAGCSWEYSLFENEEKLISYVKDWGLF